MIFSASAAMKSQGADDPVREAVEFLPPSLRHPRQALHSQFVPLAPDENSDRAPCRLGTVDAERAATASRLEARKPGAPTATTPARRTPSTPGPDGPAQSMPAERGYPPLCGLPPDLGQRLVLIVERDALPRHAIGQDALFEGRIERQSEHGKDAFQQAVPDAECFAACRKVLRPRVSAPSRRMAFLDPEPAWGAPWAVPAGPWSGDLSSSLVTPSKRGVCRACSHTGINTARNALRVPPPASNVRLGILSVVAQK